MNAAKHPGTSQERSLFSREEDSPEPVSSAWRSVLSQQCGAQRIEHARYGDKRRGAFAFNRSNDFGGIAGRFENDRGSEDRRNEERHELAKYMAQRNERDEAQRVKPALVFAICIDAALQRLKVRQKIAVRENDSARL